MFAGPTLGLIQGALLVVLLTLACASDLRTRRIPNGLVALLAVAGLALSAVSSPWISGVMRAVAGLGTGFAIWLPLYVLGVVGAGDVKLFAAASTFLGPRSAAEASLYTALYGGVVALLFMLTRSGWLETVLRLSHSIQQPSLLRLDGSPKSRRLPYALAIAAGVVTAAFWPGHILA